MTLEEIIGAYQARQFNPEELTSPVMRVLRCVRVFPIPLLEGVQVVCSPEEFDLHVPELCAKYLPSVSWGSGVSREKFSGLVEKYHLLDVAYIAPRDTTTGQNMMLEPWGPSVRSRPSSRTWRTVSRNGGGHNPERSVVKRLRFRNRSWLLPVTWIGLFVPSSEYLPEVNPHSMSPKLQSVKLQVSDDVVDARAE